MITKMSKIKLNTDQSVMNKTLQGQHNTAQHYSTFTTQYSTTQHNKTREFSIAVNVPLVNVVERMSARNIRATAHMSSFTSRRTIENCLMSARNIRASGLLRMRRVLNVRSTCPLPKS